MCSAVSALLRSPVKGAVALPLEFVLHLLVLIVRVDGSAMVRPASCLVPRFANSYSHRLLPPISSTHPLSISSSLPPCTASHTNSFTVSSSGTSILSVYSTCINAVSVGSSLFPYVRLIGDMIALGLNRGKQETYV